MSAQHHPILDLPFVADREPQSPSDKRRCFWNVSSTGDYEADCKAGEQYALAYLRYRVVSEWGALARIVKDMPRDRDYTGIEIGFLEIIDYASKYGVGAAEALVAYWE